MPKIIKDLRNKILEIAQELFTKEPYDSVDTRRISKKAGIATGTLYNYFPTKEQLFFAVFEKSWSESLQRLEQALQQAERSAESLEIFVTTAYKEFQRNKELARTRVQLTIADHVEYMKTRGKTKSDHMRPMAKHFSVVFQQAIRRQYHRALDDTIDRKVYKLLEIMPMIIAFMEMTYPDDAAENIRFLSDLIQAYIDRYIIKEGDRKI